MPEEITSAIDTAKSSGAEALNVLSSASLFYNRQIIFERAATLRLPANGELIKTRVRAVYPFVRITTATHARLDFRLSYGFVAGPGVYETTVA